jgi:nucleoid-associated protein YgaU
MERYSNNDVRTTAEGKRYYKQKYYPNIPLSETDIYVITTIGDRLDSLAFSYYNDSTLWWVISMANNNVTKGSMFPVPGTQLRIPTNLATVLSLFRQYNTTIS